MQYGGSLSTSSLQGVLGLLERSKPRCCLGIWHLGLPSKPDGERSKSLSVKLLLLVRDSVDDNLQCVVALDRESP